MVLRNYCQTRSRPRGPPGRLFPSSPTCPCPTTSARWDTVSGKAGPAAGLPQPPPASRSPPPSSPLPSPRPCPLLSWPSPVLLGPLGTWPRAAAAAVSGWGGSPGHRLIPAAETAASSYFVPLGGHSPGAPVGAALLYDTYLGFRTRSSFWRGTVGCSVPLMLLQGAHHRPQAGWEWSPWPPGPEPAETGLCARLTVSWHLVAWARDLLIHHPCAGFPQHSWCPARAWSMSEGPPESMTRAITGNLGGCGVVAHYVFFLTLPLPAAPPASRKYSVGP